MLLILIRYNAFELCLFLRLCVVSTYRGSCYRGLLLRSSFDISRIVLFAISHNMVFYCVFSLVVYSILLSSSFLSFSVTNVSRIFMCFVVMIIFVVVALGLNAFDTFIFPRFPTVFPCYKFSSLI